MKSLIPISIIVTLILSSCGSTDIISDEIIEKTPFFIETYNIGQMQTPIAIEKSGRITASSTLILTAQGAGEISKISVKEGQSVKAGAIIATLKDTQNNYDLRYSQAQNTLKIQNASIETTRINLEQAVDVSRIAYERANQSYQTLTGKNAIAYDTIVNTNSKTIDTYNESYKTYLSDTERIMTQMLYEGDKILGITTNFEYANDAWEPYLGTRVGDSRALANNEWGTTYALRGDLRARIEKIKNINLSNPTEDFQIITDSYAQSRKFADAMLYMLQNSVVGGGLPQELLSGWVAAWNGQRATIQGSEGAYNGWRSQTFTFFKGYQNTEQATKLAIKTLSGTLTPEEQSIIDTNNDLKLAFENARIDLKDKIENARLSLEQAKKSYETAQALKEATLVQLQANTENAKIALAQAARDYAKLRVTAPVEGIISRVIASVGQSVNVGTQIADFTGKQPQIIIDIEPTLVSALSVGQTVHVIAEGKTLTGIITALSIVANSNLLSTVRITIPEGQSYIGKSALIKFNPKNTTEDSHQLTLPLDAISIIAEGEGEIRYLKDGNILTKTISITAIRSSFVETDTILDGIENIIITNTVNYNPEKNIIQIATKK